MKRLFLAAALLLAAIPAARAELLCTLIVDRGSGAVRLSEGEGCDAPASPASTFKLTLAVIGFDAGILTGPDQPAWPFRKGYAASRAEWKTTTTPASWLRDSVLWYSHVLVDKLGAERFARYVAALDYGNANVSGDPGKNNGLVRSWIDSSLQISPAGQVSFLRRLLAGDLPVSAAAQAAAVAITPRFAAGDWTVTGKTGTYYYSTPRGRTDRQVGWFVGWAERGAEKVVFAHLIRDERKTAGPGGIRARDALLERFAGFD